MERPWYSLLCPPQSGSRSKVHLFSVGDWMWIPVRQPQILVQCAQPQPQVQNEVWTPAAHRACRKVT